MHHGPSRFIRLAGLFLSLLGTAVAEVSLNPPEPYAREIAPLLTPFESLRDENDPHEGEDEPGTVRLLETVTRVEEDGTYLRAVRYIYIPYTAKGAEAVATDRFRFQSRQEVIHLATARTVLPDGTVKTPGPNAVFIQKGTRASGSTYDDAQDLVVVLPDVKPGVWCEIIVVYERKEPSVRNSHGEVSFWTAGWPIGRKRHVLDFPETWKDRLRTHSLGRTPITAAIPSGDGRLRREWNHGPIGSRNYEPNPAPVAQTGPATWLTTFADWDEVAAWYHGLLEGRSELNDELKSLVDGWTAKAESPREIQTILFDKVANDVRYEGLEFGISGLQPYACATVWENQYGDCKDKSNLLAAMLRHKGIEARLVLVNTEHAGLVARHIPDFRHFDHAILLAEIPGEDGKPEPVFCDPTIRHGRPGMLAPSSADRDVLVIDGNKARWLKTPAADAGSDHYSFDLELDDSGRLSGWLTIRSTGYYGISLARSYAGVNRDAARTRLGSRVSEFIAGAEVVDFELPSERREIDGTVVKVYFTVPSRQQDDEGRISLALPSSGSLYNDFGEGKDRRTAYFMWRDRITVEARVALPQGWKPDSLPVPLRLETPAYVASARWSMEGTTCVGMLELQCREAVIAADKIAAPAQANRAMFSWLEIPLVIRPGEGETDVRQDEGVRMPLMPTGEGQLELANRWYPRGSDPAKRRAALAQVLRFFPDDRSTGYDVRIEMGYQHYDAGDFETALKAFAALAGRPPAAVDLNTVAYARYLQALTLKKLGRTGEAVDLMRNLAHDGAVSDHRRGWAATTGGRWLAEGDPVTADAVELLELAVSLEGGFRDTALGELLLAMPKAGMGEAFVEKLAEPSVFADLEDGGEELFGQLVATNDPELARWLATARDRTTDAAHRETLAGIWSNLEASLAKGAILEELRDELVAWIRETRPEDLETAAVNPGWTADEVEKRLDETNSGNRAAWMRLAADYFETFGAAQGFSYQLRQYLWKIRDITKYSDPGDRLDSLFAITDRLPKSDAEYWECQFYKAGWMKEDGNLEEAAALYQELMMDPDFDHDFDHSATHRLGEVFEQLEKWEEAIDCYTKFKDDRHTFDSISDYLLRAGLLSARAKKEREALGLWKLLADVPEARYEESDLSGEIAEAIALAADPEATLAQWKRTAEWWENSYLPFHRSLKAGVPTTPRSYYFSDAGALNEVSKSALESGDTKVIAEELARVAESSRWFPCHVASFYQMTQFYVIPLQPGRAKQAVTCAADLAEAVNAGSRGSRELCLRYAAAFRFDLGEPARTLDLTADQWQDGRDFGTEHRERCGMLYCLASQATGDKLEEALACSKEFIALEAGHIEFAKWHLIHADLLARLEGKPAAIAYLGAAAETETVRNSDETLEAIRRKIVSLEASPDGAEGFGIAVSSFLAKHQPAWYDHVGPADLSDPRMTDPEALLGDPPASFHAAELFRAWMLLALSEETPLPVRGRALALAVLEAGKWQTTWDDAAKVWLVTLNDESLPLPCRADLLWRGSFDLAMAGRVAEIGKLKSSTVYPKLNEAYTEAYFPLLEGFARGVAEGPKALAEEFARFKEIELDDLSMNVATVYHSGFLAHGDLEGAGAVREELSSLRLNPQIEPRRAALRLDLMRQTSQMAKRIEIHKSLIAIHGDALRMISGKAPAAWSARVDVDKMGDLPNEIRRRVLAARLSSGDRHDRTEVGVWGANVKFWLRDENGGLSADRLVETLIKLRDVNDDTLRAFFIISVLEEADTASKKDWQSIDAAIEIYKDKIESPATDAVVRFWQTFRDFELGNHANTDEVLGWASRSPFRAPFYSALLEVHAANGRHPELARALDAMNVEDLTDAWGIPAYLDALLLLERDEELGLLDPIIDRLIRERMLDAWLDRSASDFANACDLAIRTERTDQLPAEFLERVPQSLGDPVERAMSLAWVACLRGEWKTLKSELEKIDDERTRDKSDWNWLMARAGHGLDDPALARKHLELVINRGISGARHFRDAQRLLQIIDEKK